ncbi:MAG TPA: S41 family peptidase [Planctomycetes bacterium]|nr:S41 family peptidase [Planctomycetota bacterium]
MTHRIFALALAPALFLAWITPTGSPPEPTREAASAAGLPQSDIEALVREEAASANTHAVSELWSRARHLREADGLGEEGALDAALDHVLADRETLSPKAVLLLASARLLGEDVEPEVLADALQEILEDPDPEVARGAASLLGEKDFKALNRGRRNEIVDILQGVAENTDLAPAYRLDFAAAAYRLGSGSARRKAYGVMVSFLESSDPELSALGALTIAGSTEVDIEGRLRQTLEELAEVPGDRGRLAAAYLRMQEDRDYADRKLREMRERIDDKSELPDEFEELLAVRQLITRMHLEGGKVDPEDLIHAAIDGMLHWMDRHSSYLPSEVYSKFFQDLEADYGGIGAYVREDPDNGLFTIVRPIYSGPAYRAGLQTDDKIVRIDNWPTLGHSEEDIIKHLKGKPGTAVQLYIWRRGMDPDKIDRPTEDMKVEVIRDRIEIPAGSYQLLPGGIGLVELTTFSKKSREQMKSWIEEMRANGMKALLLDMRRNSGGLLTEAREVADLFLPPGEIVVKTEGRTGPPDVLRTREPALLPEDMPVVILTSRLTASAAEIVSGALQDHHRAILVGNRTYGKGSVQQLIPILRDREDSWDDANGNYRWDEGEKLLVDHNGNGEADYAPRVKLTIARYLLPSGRSIHRELDREGNMIAPGGVQPDHVVDLPLMERWRFDERERVRKSDVLRDYIDRNYPKHVELFHRLAVNDSKDPSLYPEFDQLVMDLETSLGRDDVRSVLRREIRRRVQDDLGHEFPFGDYEEDVQVQKGIEVILEALGESVDDISQYGLVFDLPDENASDRDVALLDPHGNRRLHRVRELLEEARAEGNTLSPESLDELIGLIDTIEGEEN